MHDVYTLNFEVLSRLAAHNNFDLYRRRHVYIIVSSAIFTESELVYQWEDTPYGYLLAYDWMKHTAGPEWRELRL